MKNILICVSGLTPQIITETLYCLSIQKNTIIDELYVVTTTRGRAVIQGLDKEYNKERKYPPLKNEMERMCTKYKKIKLPKFNKDQLIVSSELSIELPDIRSDNDNKLFPNTLCDLINVLSKEKNNVLHCSISGGRKSMSVDMAFALSLFGRENDQLWHVLTHENREFKHFFPENKKQEKDLELANLPYVKLRSIISRELGNERFKKLKYSDLVNFTQNELMRKTADKLFISSRRREIWYGENDRVKIEPKQIELYRYFLEYGSNFNKPVKIDALINHFSIDKRTGEKIKGFDETNIRQHISKLNNNKIIPAFKDTELADMFVIHSGAYGSGEFYINVTNENVEFID